MTTASQPLVSIVTPVYNGAEHLAECIESILAQTHQSWDCSIADNCSTDGSAEIARRYAAKDPRIRFCPNSRFLPALSNHNGALRHISPASKYCKVVFADDWIFPECLEKMVAVAEDHPSVGLVGAYCLKDRQVVCTGLPYSTTVAPGLEICRKHLLDGLYLFGSANSVLYRSDLVRGRDPFFDERNIHADTEACFALLKTCDFGFVHQVLTFSRVQAGSRRALSEDLGSDFAGMLKILVMHGQDYLTEKELEARLKRHVTDYYRFLGTSLFVGRDQTFWEYHKKHLRQANLGFSRARLAQAALVDLFFAALSPRETIEKVLKSG